MAVMIENVTERLQRHLGIQQAQFFFPIGSSVAIPNPRSLIF